jgi:hypothetical protein
MYAIIGWIAVEVAFGRSGQQADRTGALHEIGTTPAGSFMLWLLVIGFIGMALRQLSEAVYGLPGSGQHHPAERLAALGRMVYLAVPQSPQTSRAVSTMRRSLAIWSS